MRTAIEKALDEIRPTGFLDYKLFLAALFKRLKQDDAKYNYQKFAKDLGFAPSTIVHQIVQGYRPLSLKNAERIAKALGLQHHEKKYFLALVSFNIARSSSKKQQTFDDLLAIKRDGLPEEFDKQYLDYFKDWFNPVVLELVATESFQADPQWISKRITPRITPQQAKTSLELLCRLNLITFDEAKQRYIPTQSRVSTGHRVKGMALASYHMQMIDHAKLALSNVSGKRRDISAVTVNVSEETAQKLRAMIHTFQLQLLEAAESSGGGDQVYQMNIQWFPFTK
jgi:uncharacterized protein (TIGR02147 family)